MKKRTCILSLLLAAVLILGMVGCGPAATPTPTVSAPPPTTDPNPVPTVFEISATVLADAVTETVTVDSSNPLATELSGLYSIDAELEGGGTRALYHYVPETVGYRQPAVAIGVPSSVAADAFMESSGWKAIADANGIHLILMTAAEGGWADDESAYTAAAFEYMDGRKYMQMQDSAFYMVGYGDSANAVMAFSLLHSELFAGFAAFGVDDFDATLMDAAKAEESNAAGVMKSSVAVPVWIGAKEETASVTSLVDYWKSANQSGDETYSNEYADQIYQFPTYMANTSEITYANCAKVLVTIGTDATETPEFTDYLYNDFLKRTRRQDSGDINALRPFATNDEKGMELCTLEVEGTKREFYVYVPTDVKNGRYENVPVVFAFHGGGGSGEEFAGRSGWDKLAEERNFIAVFATGHRSNDKFKASTTWGAEDLPFFEAMRTYMLEKYSADETRIYVSGQSMGCIMSCTIALTHPEWIAACAATSALLMPEDVENKNTDLVMPFMWSVGEKDQYFVEGGKDFGLMPVCIGQWRERYGITADESGTYTYQNGNFHGYDFKNSQGVTVIREQLVTDKIHAMLPDEVYSLYDFMSCYTRDTDGTSYYMGAAISAK